MALAAALSMEMAGLVSFHLLILLALKIYVWTLVKLREETHSLLKKGDFIGGCVLSNKTVMTLKGS